MSEIPMPKRVAALPRDKHGRPVPWFVAWLDGVPDFRVVEHPRIAEARRFDLCWICGQRRGVYGAFVIGPMCAINRIAPEPPSHRDCAIYSARACPFLATPTMSRRANHMPDGTVPPGGIAILRNPGVTLVWVTRSWEAVDSGRPGAPLFSLGEPTETLWYAEGREATRAEVLDSIESGYPLLLEQARADDRPELAVAQLERQREAANTYLPGGHDG